METLTLLVDTIAVVLVVWFSMKNEQRPDEPEIGFFRIVSPKTAPEPREVAAPRRRARF